MNEHRVPMLGGAWRHRGDPLRSSDPRVRELVGALAGLEIAPAPRPEFRAELRAQLVAVAPRLIAEGEVATTAPAEVRVAAAEKARHKAADADRPRRRLKLLKPLVTAACVLTAFVLLLGGAVLISQHALPGDALYGVKRVSEDTEYRLTGGSVAKGRLKLEFAARRIGEVGDLLPRPSALAGGSGVLADGAGINSDTAALVRQTLGSADGDVQTAAQLLGGDAVRTGNADPLDVITSWTPGQIKAMRAIVGEIPAGALHQRALATLRLLRDAQQRAAALRADLGCSCLSTTNTDSLGPLPCAAACAPSATVRKHQTNHHTRSTTPRRPGSSVTPVAPPAPATASHSASVTPGEPASSTTPPPLRQTHPGAAVSPTPTGGPSSPTLPPLPLPTPTLPVLGGGSGSGHKGSPLPITVNPSCASVSAGPIQIGVGKC